MQITNNNSTDDKPIVKDNHIFWRNDSDGDFEIYMYTIGSSMPDEPYQDNNSNIIYTGDWTTQYAILASRGAYETTGQADASASFTFSGRHISLLYTSGPDFGNIEIIVDSGAPVLLDQSGAELSYQNQWDSLLLEMGTHTIVFSPSWRIARSQY